MVTPKIPIHNVRLGFACNSSSTHSIIIRSSMTDRDAGGYYGWNDFTLASQPAKKSYLAAMLCESLRNYPTWVARLIASAVVGQVGSDDGVDHQSTFSMPLSRHSSYGGERSVDRRFISELWDYLKLDDIVILGGNDNSDGHSQADDTAFTMPWGTETGTWWCKKDEGFKYWTLFNPENGSRVRLSFPLTAEPLTVIVPDRATTPELVDFKITDYCTSNCRWCYQGSSPTGKHAAKSVCDEVAATLRELDVFEVALGGGEPTSHPDFTHIVTYMARDGIIVNFTTAKIDWLARPDAEEILDAIGQFAYTPTGTRDMHNMYDALVRAKGNPDKASIQIVLGTLDQRDFESRLRKAHGLGLQVVLLGYKPVGRGSGYQPKNYDWWTDSITKLSDEVQLPKLGIDTVLAAAYQNKLDEIGIPPWLYHTTDGRFSCYVDAVTEAAGPSSYSDASKMTPFVVASLPGQKVRRYNDVKRAILTAMHGVEVNNE